MKEKKNEYINGLKLLKKVNKFII